MRWSLRNILLATFAVLFLNLPPAYWLAYKRGSTAVEPAQVFAAYIKASYARDFTSAYQLISLPDRRLKTEQIYAQERGSFNGFTLQAARKISEFVRFEAVDSELAGSQARIKLRIQFPDPDSLSRLLLDWNETKLNSLSLAEQRKILASLELLGRQNKLAMRDSVEESLLLKEGRNWRVFFDWASGVRVNFRAVVPGPGIINAAPVIKHTRVRRKEPFTISYRVQNRTQRDVFTRVVHRVEPIGLTRYLRMFECSLLLPIRLLPGEQSEYSTTYMVDGDLPDGAKELNITYEFQLES